MARNDAKIRLTVWVRGDNYDAMHRYTEMEEESHADFVRRAIRKELERVGMAPPPQASKPGNSRRFR